MFRSQVLWHDNNVVHRLPRHVIKQGFTMGLINFFQLTELLFVEGMRTRILILTNSHRRTFKT